MRTVRLFYLDMEVRDEKDQSGVESPRFNPKFAYITQLRPPAYSYDFIQALPSLKAATAFRCSFWPTAFCGVLRHRSPFAWWAVPYTCT